MIPFYIVTICRHKKLLKYYWLYFLCCTFNSMTFILQHEVCTSWSPTSILFIPTPSLWQPSVYSLYLWVCFCFVLFFRFYTWVKSHSKCLCPLSWFYSNLKGSNFLVFCGDSFSSSHVAMTQCSVLKTYLFPHTSLPLKKANTQWRLRIRGTVRRTRLQKPKQE